MKEAIELTLSWMYTFESRLLHWGDIIGISDVSTCLKYMMTGHCPIDSGWV